MPKPAHPWRQFETPAERAERIRYEAAAPHKLPAIVERSLRESRSKSYSLKGRAP